MIRKLLLFGLLAVPALSGAQDVHSILVKRYEELNNAIVKRDSAAIEKWVKANLAADFLYTSGTYAAIRRPSNRFKTSESAGSICSR